MADYRLFTLLDQASSKEPEAVNTLIQKYYPFMYETAFLITSNEGNAEKAVENTCIRMMNELASLNDASYFEQWLDKITREESLKFAGADIKVLSDVPYDPSDEQGTDAGEVKGSSKKKQEIIQKVFKELSPEERLVFSMHFKDGKTVNEIADEVNLSYKEAGSLLQSSKNKVNAEIKEQEEKENLKTGAFSPLGFFAVLLKGWNPEPDPGIAARISTIITGSYKPADYQLKENIKISKHKTVGPSSIAAEAAPKTAAGFFASTAGKIVVAAAVAVGAVGAGKTVYANINRRNKDNLASAVTVAVTAEASPSNASETIPTETETASAEASPSLTPEAALNRFDFPDSLPYGDEPVWYS